MERLCVAVTTVGWRCLSEVWIGYNERYEFECTNGHRFERNATALLYQGDQACCEGCEGDDIETRWLAAIAARRETLIDGAFRGLSGRYGLRCSEGHEWEATGEPIRRGKWCPICGRANSARCDTLADGLARLQAIASHRGGQRQAKEYTRSRDRYLFECSKGHRWESSSHMVVHGHWCAQCASIGRRHTLDTMLALAKERGGVW